MRMGSAKPEILRMFLSFITLNVFSDMPSLPLLLIMHALFADVEVDHRNNKDNGEQANAVLRLSM